MDQISVRHQSLPIHLGPSMHRQAAAIAQRAGVSLNYFICQAVQEKLGHLDGTVAVPAEAERARQAVQ